MPEEATVAVPMRDIGRGFDVLGAFQQLETSRKMALFDILMAANDDHSNSFRRTVEFLWPHSSRHDAMRLETFLRRRLSSPR